jgi:hypothetical protein
MSDVEEKKSGYRLEYAKNNRAKCKGSFPSQLLISSIAFLIVVRVLSLQGRNLAPVRDYSLLSSEDLISQCLDLGTVLEKGGLKLGSVVDFRGHTSLYVNTSAHNITILGYTFSHHHNPRQGLAPLGLHNANYHNQHEEVFLQCG